MNIAKQGFQDQVQYVGLFKDGIPLMKLPEDKAMEIRPDSVMVSGGHRLAGKAVEEVDPHRVSVDPWSGDPNGAQHDAGGEG